MWCFNKVPGFVRPYWRRRIVRLCGANTRSIWRALIAATPRSVAAANASRRRAQGSHWGSNALSRRDQG